MSLTKKQRDVFDYICTYADEWGYAPTQKEIQDNFCLKSLGSVHRYIKYLVNAGLIINEERAHRGIQIVQKFQTRISSSDNSHQGSSTHTQLPLLGKVAAGNPIEAIENCSEMMEVPDYLLSSSSGQHFVLQVEGESMINLGILPNDYLVCRRQSAAKNGQVVIALWENEATVKSFYHHGDKIELRPANDSLDSFWPTAEDFHLAGTVVGLFRKFY